MAAVRQATAQDAATVGEMLHAFNTEFGEPSPGPQALARRLASLMDDDTTVLLAGDPPAGIAVVRFRPSIWSPGHEAHLAELWVEPGRRNGGLGRALLDAVLAKARARGADYLDLNADEPDTAAHRFYERAGLQHTARYYEIDLRDGRPSEPGANP